MRLPVLEDEAYYWTWSQQLALHYYDHPPLVAWLLRGAQALGFGSFAALRVVSLGCWGLTIAGLLATARAIPSPSGDGVGWALASSAVLTLALLPATPDAPLAALLAWGNYALVRSLAAPSDSAAVVWPIVTGGLYGAAVLAKLPALLVAVGVAAGTMATAQGRRAWRGPGPWIGVAFAAGIAGLWWMAAPAVPDAVRFQAARVTGHAPRWGLAAPMTLGAALLVVGVAGTRALLRRPSTPAAWALTGGAVAVFGGCTVAVGLGAGELNWLLPVAICGIPAAGANVRGVWRTIAQLQSVGIVVVLSHVIVPWLPVSPARDRTLRSAGWARVADEVDARASAIQAKAVVADGYQRASLLRFYLSDRWPVFERGQRRRSQYDLWPRPPVCAGDPVVVVHQAAVVPTGIEPIAPSREVDRGRAGRTVERVFVTSGRASARWSSCAR